ncbi:YjbH domain-containing protein [Pistricoccus aurantiacus]|nr:YjbH domain-containing protein [Pistricoccus aurantiacus]
MIADRRSYACHSFCKADAIQDRENRDHDASAPRQRYSRLGLSSSVLISSFFLAAAAQAMDPALSQSDFGGVGLMQTPTARMAPAGQFSFSYNQVDPYRRYNFTFQPLDWLEAGFRYSEIDDRLYGEAIAGDRDYLDKGFDAKFRLWQESRRVPEIALGFRDIGGTSLFGGEYLVASKRWYDFDFTLGLGWGYLGGRGDIDSPFGWIDDRFDDRPRPDVGEGGDFDLDQLFRGPMAFFGGVQYQTPWEPLSLMLEYDGNDYENDPAGEPIDQDSPFNFGARLKLTDYLALNAGFERGDTAMFGIAYSVNLADISQVKRDPQPVALQSAPESTTNDWPAVSQKLEDNAGVRVSRIIARDDKTLVVEGEPVRFRSLIKTEGRANRILNNEVDKDVETFRYRWQSRGMDLREDIHSRKDFVAALQAEQEEIPYLYGIYAQAASKPRGEVLHENKPQRFRYSIGPGLDQNLGGPDGYLYRLYLDASAEYFTDTNGWFSGTLAWTLFDNLDDYEYIADSDLPRVRTFIGDYLEEGDLGLTNLQYTRTAKLNDNWYAMGYGGYLEMMYAGVGGEVLYRPFNSAFALGADINYVKQRDFDQQFGLRDYDTVTGHLSAYVETGVKDVLAKFSLGRYLAEDWGGTIDLSRQFDSGVRMGAWATFTDVSSEEYGEGSFDKGLYVSLPLDAFFTTSSRSSVGLSWSPLTRDGGARLNKRYELYNLTGERNLGRYWKEIDKVWE